MAYDGSQLSFISKAIGQLDGIWLYRDTATFLGTVDGASFFSDGYTRGMRTGQLLIYHKTDGTVPAFGYVSAVTASSGVATVTALGSSGGAGAFTTLTTSGTTTIGDAAADTISFYGATAASQRASSVQATSNIASSTDFGATQLAVVQEIMTTLKGLGLWKGTA